MKIVVSVIYKLKVIKQAFERVSAYLMTFWPCFLSITLKGKRILGQTAIVIDARANNNSGHWCFTITAITIIVIFIIIKIKMKIVTRRSSLGACWRRRSPFPTGGRWNDKGSDRNQKNIYIYHIKKTYQMHLLLLISIISSSYIFL